MSYADTVLPEFDAEMANTRKLLECLPDEKFAWQAAPALRTIGWNANHVTEIVGWLAGVLAEDSFDIAPPDGPRYETPELGSRREILESFDANVAAARQAIQAAREDQLDQMWSLLEAGNPLITMPRSAVIRILVLNHLIHHRAHLSVYLRLCGVAVPPMYGG